MSKKLEQLEEQKRALIRKIKEEKSRASRQRRQDDTRRKILIGSMILANDSDYVAVKKRNDDQWEIIELRAAMHRFLAKHKDRQLFNLEDKE